MSELIEFSDDESDNNNFSPKIDSSLKVFKNIVHLDIEKDTLSNEYYRNVVYTDKFTQLVLMSIKPKKTISLENHNGTQFIRIEKGNGIITTKDENEKGLSLTDGVAILIPPNTQHFIKNTGDIEMKLYSLYSPPQHAPNTQK